MAAKKYSAGTIFLQVSPVFRRFQEEVADYVKDIDRALGDDMEKSGERAGQRAGKAMGKAMASEYEGHFESSVKRFVKNAEKEIGRLDLSTASEKMLRDLDEAKKKLRDLRDQDFNLDFNSKEVIRDLAKVQTAVEALTAGDHEINVDSNINKVLTEVKGALAYIDKEVARKREINVDVMTGDAERKMGAFEKKIKATMKRAAEHIDNSANAKVRELHKELERLGKLRVGIDISGGRLRAEAEQIMRELKTISDTDLEIDARFDSGRAFAELAAFDESLDRVDGRTVRVRAVADTASAQRGLFGLARSSDDAANSFRSFNIILLAAAGAGPALIPILGAIAGGLLAVGPAAAVAVAGLSSVLIGFTGLGDVLTSYDALQKQQGMNAQTAARANQSAAQGIRDAARGVADAERNAADAAADAAQRVKDARQQAADAVEAALERQRDAQERYRDSIEDVRDAEIALAEARKAARGQGADIQERIDDNALAQDQGLLDVFNATVTYNATMADGSATNAEQEQARINLERARDALDDLRKEERELRKEQRKWQKEGVNGTDEVKDAQDRLNDALEAQREAYEGVRDAAKEVDEARADGARMVADAIEAQNRTLADNARAVERAKENLARARQASDDLTTSVNSQENAFRHAMDALGPAGRRFARFLIGLKDDFRRFRNDIQTAMLPSIQEAIEGFLGSKNGSTLRKAMVSLAGGFGDFVKALSQSFQGPAWAGFFQMLADLGPDIQAAYGQAFVSFLEAMASILTTLAPYALEFAEGLARMMDSFAAWAAGEGSATIVAFMEAMQEIGPDVLTFFGVLAAALTNVIIALAPYSELILRLLTGFLDWVAGMDPDRLAIFLTSLLGLITASQIAYSVMNLLLAGTALLTSTVGLLVFTFAGLALAVYYVYTQNETLGKILAVLLGVVYAAIIGWRAYRAIVMLVSLAKFGYMAATTGAAVATSGLTAAQRVAMAVGRAYAGVQALMRALMATNLVLTLRNTAATVASFVATKAIAVATRAWAAAQFLLNAAMRLNPLGIALTAILAIGAGMVWAYRHFEGFRNVVDTVVNAVADAFFWLWDFLFGHSVMPDIIDGMEWFFDKLSAIFGWIKTKVIGPVARAFQWLWKNVIKPVAKFIGAAVKAAFTVIVSSWKNVLWPVLKAIGKVVFTLWKAYFKVVFTLIKALVKVVFTLVKAYWNNILYPVFKIIGKVLGWLWDNVFKPTLTWIGDKFEGVFRGMKWVWERILKPVFDFMMNKALPKLKGAFETAVDGIKRVWEGLKRVVGAPIKFVLDTVINKGLIAGFNKVAGWVNMDGFREIPIPDSIARYATGGILPGYTPGRDPHKFYSPTGGRLELSGGEAIMRPEFTAAVGSGFVNAANAAARSGGIDGVRRLLGGGQAFARGGIFWPVPQGWYVNRSAYNLGHDGMDINHPNDTGSGQGGVVPFMSATPGRVSYVGYGRGYGLATFVQSPYGELVYGHAYPGSPRVSAGQPVSPGQVLGLIGNTGNSSAPHLHFGFPGGTFYAAERLLNGAGVLDGGDIKASGGKGFSVPRWIKTLLTNPISTIKGWATSQFSKASDFITDSPVWDVVKNVPSNLVGGFKDKVWDIMPGWAKRTVGVAGDVVSGIGRGLDAIVPGDGIPGVGGAGVSQGIAQAEAYANGGILPYNGTMMYDDGGYLPPGLTSVVNLTGKPEPVFTAEQWDNVAPGAGGGNIHYEPHFEGSDLTAADVAGDLNFTFRRIRRGGRYEGVGR